VNLTNTCLNDDQLRRLASNEMSTPELKDIEDHIDGCERCRDVLKSVGCDANWLGELASALMEVSEGIDSLNVGAAEIDGDTTLRSLLTLLGPTDDPRMLGRIGTYEVVGIIGRGGMGVVFKAFDASLNRFVAIKMLLPHLAVSGAARKRFAREGQAAAAVVDDHVLPIYGVAEWQGVPYLVTQYSRSTTLQRRIEDQGPLELREILRIGMQTAKGLAAAHAQGLVHRDIKPSNILLDKTVERAMLTDFGLARAVDDATLTRSGIIAGTPGYMSPEQTRGDPIDHRSDLFSLGAVLYAMCTGRPPFRAETTFGILHRIREEAPRSIRQINPDLPGWVDRIVMKLLAKQPDDRFASAQITAILLEQCLAHVQQPTIVKLPDSIDDRQDLTATADSPQTRRSRGLGVHVRRVALSLLIPVAGSVMVYWAITTWDAKTKSPAESKSSLTQDEPPLLWGSTQTELDAMADAVDLLDDESAADLNRRPQGNQQTQDSMQKELP
jgi:serine/threonine-protein kinase